MPNRLISETSPYLLQHADNPVDWYPWGEEALALAEAEDRPLFVSIGYAACHWCHVMEHESFEDGELATYLNEHFVPVKIDREERPDIDSVYMDAVQAMSGHGGWPLSVFCQPDGTPFYGGTYFPPVERGGMPSFRMVLEAVVASWSTRREQIREVGVGIRDRLGASARIAADEALDPSLPEQALELMLDSADLAQGGFGGAPKFPPPLALDYLLAKGEHAVVESTLAAMADGGIHDQLGGGFARYSVDSAWLVPHFEKMLYDNAMLARSYLHAWQETRDPRWREVCESTLDWMLAEMLAPADEDESDGGGMSTGFYSSLDADSEGAEGLFYVWQATDVARVLLDADLTEDEIAEVIGFWGITPDGNFEGANILYRADGVDAEPPECLGRAREALLAARADRIRPATDDKRILSWNALAVSALAEAGAVLGRPDYLTAATDTASFIWDEMRDENGRLLRTWKEGHARISAFLEDHAYLADALLTLYEATFDKRWYERSRSIADLMIEQFHDTEAGGFFTTATDADAVVARRKDITDHPIPSGNSAAAVALLRLGAISGEGSYTDAAEGTLRMFVRAAGSQPLAAPWLLHALDLALNPIHEIAVVSPVGLADAGNELINTVRGRYRPRTVLAAGEEGAATPELLADRPAGGNNEALAYVCQSFTCQTPVSSPEELEALLAD